MSNMKQKQVCKGVTLITNFGIYGDIGLYLDAGGKLLVLSDGEIDYIVEGIELDEAYDFIDMLDNEPECWERYGLDDDSKYYTFQNYFGDRESVAEGLKWLGVIPESAKVTCDVDAEYPLVQYLRDLLAYLG